MSVRRVMGIETEYGIAVPGQPWANPMTASGVVVTTYARAHGLRAGHGAWDYSDEHPLVDARGFELPRSRADISQLTDEEDPTLANVVLGNGAINAFASGHGFRRFVVVYSDLFEVGGRALIDHVLDRLADAGVEKAVVNVHWFADRLEAHLAARGRGPQIVISDERAELLETGGGLKKARALLGDDPVFVANIDSVWIDRGDAPGLGPAPPVGEVARLMTDAGLIVTDRYVNLARAF